METARSFAETTKCVAALGIASWFAVVQQDLAIRDFLPFRPMELLSLLWLGIPVTLCVTLARHANNCIGDTVASSVDGFRPILGMIFIFMLGFAFPGNEDIVTWVKVSGGLIATLGMLICLSAKPSRSS